MKERRKQYRKQLKRNWRKGENNLENNWKGTEGNEKTIEKELKGRRKQFRGPSGPLRLVWLCPGALGWDSTEEKMMRVVMVMVVMVRVVMVRVVTVVIGSDNGDIDEDHDHCIGWMYDKGQKGLKLSGKWFNWWIGQRKLAECLTKTSGFTNICKWTQKYFPSKLCITLNGTLNLSTEWAIITKNDIQSKKCLLFHWAAQNLMLNMESARISKVI